MEHHTLLIVHDTTVKWSFTTLRYSMLFKLTIMKIIYQILSDLSRNNTVITFLVLQCVINPRNSRLTVICTVSLYPQP